LLQVSPRKATQTMISSYIKYIPINQELNDRRSTQFRIASLLLFGIVALLFVLSAIQGN